MLVQHSAQGTVDGIHVPYSFEYFDTIEREAAIGFVEEDIGKLAIQNDSKTLWMLTGIAPITWLQISLSQIEKEKLDSIQTSAEVNQNAFSKILASGNEILASQSTDTLRLGAGTGVSLTANPANKEILIQAASHAVSHLPGGSDQIPDATATTSGLMTPAEKAKLATVKNLVAGTNIILTPQGGNLVIASTAVATGHGALSGLENDDHPQYLNTARHNTLLHEFGGNIPHDSLKNLSDTNIVAPSNDQFLVYFNGNWTNKTLTIGGSGTTSHSLLSDLANDDHPQYLNTTRHSALLHELGSNIPHDSLKNLSDTNISSPANKQVLSYLNNFWVNTSNTIENLTNVNITNPLDNDVLVYSNGKWINRLVSGSGGAGDYVSHASSHITGGTDAIPLATTTSDGLMSKEDKTALTSIDPTRLDDLVSKTSDNTISASHTFSNGSNYRSSDGQNIPIDIRVDGTAIPAAALLVRSTNSAERADGTVRWGIYAEHASYGAVIGTVPTGISYGGFHCRVKSVSKENAHCYVANNDKVDGSGSLFYGGSDGTGALIKVTGTNASATHAVNVATAGSGHAAYFTQNGTGRGVMSYVDALGDAAFFAQVGSGNTDTANGFLYYGLQQGLGPGARFDITNTSNAQAALNIRHMGNINSWLGSLTHTGEGHGLYINVATGKEGIRVVRGNVNINNGGNLYVSGTLSKASGTFLIDHPLNPKNQTLAHSFVESPDMKNIYDGEVTLDASGTASIQLPDYFGALNKDFRYQLTPLLTSMPNLCIGSRITNNCFTIIGGTPGGQVAWQVTGIRQDKFALANPIIVEQNKQEPGYLHPELY